MQEDSPGRQDKHVRNERYSTPTKPKKLSVITAKQKAKEFAAKDDKSTRVLAKQAIVKELQTHLTVEAQGIALRNRREAYGSGNDSEYIKPNKGKQEEKKPGAKLASKIPRRIDGASAGTANKKSLKSSPKLWQKDHHETAVANRGSEIFDENRERYLAEKYSLIWKRRTYGRVTPVIARIHYEKKLKQRALEVWQDIWWSGRKGWKLNVRADYHNRYRLWQKAWRAWREYIKYCRGKKAKENLAQLQAHNALLVKYCYGWKEYIRIRRSKQQLTDQALDLAQKQLKRRVWEQWLAQLAFRRHLKYMDREALGFWANSLMTKAWRVWYAAWSLRIEEKEKLKVASRFYNQALVLRVWRALKNFRSIRKLKQLRHGAASRHYSFTMLRKSFVFWVERWQREVELAQFDDLVSFKGAVAVTRRVFIHWKHYVVLKHEGYENEDDADRHYRQHLLKMCFNALHLKAVHRRLKEMRMKMAADLCQRIKLQRVWNVWLKRCEHSEELKLHSVSKKARAHYSFQLRRKLFAVWVRYCRWRRFRKSQYGMADYHFRERALPRYFCRMMVFVDLMHAKKEKILAAEKFRREALQAKTFYLWWRKYQLIMDLRMMERMAILHNDEIMKRRCLRFWLQRAREKLRERELQAEADDHHNRRLLLMGLTRWIEFNREMKESRSVQRSSLRHYYIRLLKKSWMAWEQFVHHRQVKWQKQVRADLHYQRHIFSTVITAWKDHHSHAKAAEAHCERKLQRHNFNRLRFAFEMWKQNVRENKAEQQNKEVARTFLNQTLLSKCFFCWREFATRHTVKKWKQWQQVQEIQKDLEKGKLHRSFRAWKSFTRKSVYDRNLKLKADGHHKKTLMNKMVLMWKGYVRLCFRIKILQRQSMWLHNRRITASFFSKWKKQHSAAVREKRQTVLALWQWSVTLQRKAFYAILEYAISRKRKAARISRALEERRNRLLRIGVTRWMKVGFHLAAERSRLAQERQLEAAHSVHRCVYRCAMHWRRLTAKRVRQRGGRPRSRPVSEAKHNWPLTSMLEPKRPGPSAQPASYGIDIDRIISETFKERPAPRKPDYLRESFDLTQITMETNLPPSVQSTHVHVTARDDDETKPRPSLPVPYLQMRSNIHPHQRNPREESIVFPSSSCDETSSLLTEGPGESRMDAYDLKTTVVSEKQPGSTNASTKPVQIPAIQQLDNTTRRRSAGKYPVLLPPSSFMLPSRSKGLPLQASLPEGVVVHDSNSTHPASTPRTSLDSQKLGASSPATSTSSGGSEEDERDDPPKAGCGEIDETVGKIDGEEDGEGESEEEGDDDRKSNGELEDKGLEYNKIKDETTNYDLPRYLREKENLQRRIAAMKNTLQEFQDLKVTYNRKRRQRDQLFVWVREQREKLGPNHEDEELLQTEQCLDELTQEVNEIVERMNQTRPLVEKVAASIRELIQKAGLESLE